ncbi:MAG: asparagine synthase-related protein [Candidatus Bathyarchaeia archaeon]
MKAIAAAFDKRGGNAVQAVFSMLKVLGRGRVDAFTLATPKNIDVKNSLEQFSQRGFKSPTVLGHVFLKVLAQENIQPIQVEKAVLVFDGRIYHPFMEFPEAEFIEQKLQTSGEIEETAEALVRDFDGSFAFAIAENEKLVAGRDALGLYPLYYGEKNGLFALASERKALWKIGLDNAKPLPPGHILVVNREGFRINFVKIPPSITRQTSMEAAVEKLEKLLAQSMIERTAGLKKVAVAFSGGLDSSLTAFLAKKAGVDIYLIHVSLENQRETLQAEETARLLGLPFYKYLYNEEDVERVLPKVLWCIESSDPLKTSVGIPVYWAAERVAELGFGVMLAGQGADELFGGYKRYLTLYSSIGSDSVEKAIARDVLRLHEDSFERDAKICVFHGIELRLPFASYPLIEFALSLPLNLKIESTNDALRKSVLRKTAEKLGLPKQIAYKPKKAVQYATGVDKTLKRLAKRRKMSLKKFLQKIFQSLW